jgi:hypothetical protein
VVPAECMKIVVVSGVCMSLIAEYVVHIGNILLVPASYGHDPCCIWPRNLSVIWSLSLCLVCVGLSNGHSNQQFLSYLCG